MDGPDENLLIHRLIQDGWSQVVPFGPFSSLWRGHHRPAVSWVKLA